MVLIYEVLLICKKTQDFGPHSVRLMMVKLRLLSDGNITFLVIEKRFKCTTLTYCHLLLKTCPVTQN